MPLTVLRIEALRTALYQLAAFKIHPSRNSKCQVSIVWVTVYTKPDPVFTVVPFVYFKAIPHNLYHTQWHSFTLSAHSGCLSDPQYPSLLVTQAFVHKIFALQKNYLSGPTFLTDET